MTRTPRPGRHLGLGILGRVKSTAAALAVAVAGVLLSISVTGGPASRLVHAQSPDSSLDFAENRTSPVGLFLAYDQDGDAIEWSLSGPDDGLFTIDDGVLAFREPPTTKPPSPGLGPTSTGSPSGPTAAPTTWP